jgi:GNAT superfamily N-acetyltransferase
MSGLAGLEVGQFQDADAPAASALIRRCWTTMDLGGYSQEAIDLQLAGTTPDKLREGALTTIFFVAVHNGRVVGLGGHSAERVRLIFVEPDFQRQGVGTFLLSHVLASARSRGMASIGCYSTFFAESFYSRHGFARVGIVDFGVVKFVSMSVRLQSSTGAALVVPAGSDTVQAALHHAPEPDVRRRTGVAVEVGQAQEGDAGLVSAVLTEAAEWLDSIGQSLWQCNDLAADRIAEDVGSGLYYIAWMGGEAVGVLRFQTEDKQFWPDAEPGSSAFIHRLAVRRKVAGRGVAAFMLNWAKDRTRSMGRGFLRLDCDLRPKLCALYERNGFTKHSERLVGPYLVARYEYCTGKREQADAADASAPIR